MQNKPFFFTLTSKKNVFPRFRTMDDSKAQDDVANGDSLHDDGENKELVPTFGRSRSMAHSKRTIGAGSFVGEGCRQNEGL